jgi:hypothetical protein
MASLAAAAMCASCLLAPADAFLPGSGAFAGSGAKLSLRAARSSTASYVPDFLRLPKLRRGADIAGALQMAISDESMISTGGGGGFFT